MYIDDQICESLEFEGQTLKCTFTEAKLIPRKDIYIGGAGIKLKGNLK